VFLHSFSFNCGFIPLGFYGKVFNEADYDTRINIRHINLAVKTRWDKTTEFFSGKVLMRHILDGQGVL